MRHLWIILFLLGGGLLTAQCPTHRLEPTFKDWLRHEKHGLLAYGVNEQGQAEAWLVTRQKIHRRPWSPTSAETRQLRVLKDIFRRHPKASSQSSEAMFTLAHQAYLSLVAPFRSELDQLYQISIFPGHPLACGIPFEALVLDDNGPLSQRRFLTEVWAVSYLLSPDFLPVKQRTTADSVAWDDKGSYWKGHRHPREGSFVSNSEGFECWACLSIREQFEGLVREGYYVDEALGRSRGLFLDSLRGLAPEGDGIPQELDPRFWAADRLIGDIAPIHTSRGIPWWVLVPLGLMLVILFGKRL